MVLKKSYIKLLVKTNNKNGVSHRPKSQLAVYIIFNVYFESLHSSKLFTREVLNFQFIGKGI